MSNELIKINRGDIVSYIHNVKNEVDLPKPFEKEVFLYDTYISEVNNAEGIKDGRMSLSIGERLQFYRESDNRFDSKTIVIKTRNDDKVGFVPNKDNAVFARLMDAGKEVFCKVSRIEERDDLLKVRIKIYMID
jgi:hypothetical protein